MHKSSHSPVRILALDHGTKRIGIALSDELKMIAQPLEFVLAEPIADFFVRLKEIIREASQLPESDRATLAGVLIESLDPGVCRPIVIDRFPASCSRGRHVGSDLSCSQRVRPYIRSV